MTQVDDLAQDTTTADFGEVGPMTYAVGAAVLMIWGLLAAPFLSPMSLFLPIVVPVALWVAWSDMATMKIPNQAVSVLLLSYAVLGLFAFSVDDYLWRWSHFAVVIVIGFVANMLRLIGAGDAKFVAAVAPLVALEDATGMIRLFAATLLAAFATHRLARAYAPLRDLVPHWESWKRSDFPMGLALGGMVACYTVLLVAYGR